MKRRRRFRKRNRQRLASPCRKGRGGNRISTDTRYGAPAVLYRTERVKPDLMARRRESAGGFLYSEPSFMLRRQSVAVSLWTTGGQLQQENKGAGLRSRALGKQVVGRQASSPAPRASEPIPQPAIGLAQERYRRRLEKIPEASVPRFLSGDAPLHGRAARFVCRSRAVHRSPPVEPAPAAFLESPGGYLKT
jgi:hypothetical protein